MIDQIRTHIDSQKDFYFFCTEVLGYKRNDDYEFHDLTYTHEELCGFLQADDRNKLILMPRYSFKSGVITVGYSLWRMVKNPNIRILIYSDSATKAQGFLQGIKNHIEGKAPNSRFREFYPKWETDPHKGKWNESQINIRVRKNAYVEPSVDTGGIESTKIGMHYDMIIFDDIVSDINTTTKALMDKVHDCYKKSLSLLKPNGDIVIVGTRWHFGDAYGRIITDNTEKKNFKLFIKDAEERKDGELIFEGIGLNEEFLKGKRSEQGSYIYSCNPYEAPILMEDFTMKPIGEVEVGEYVVGWKRDGGNKKLVRSKVLSKNSRFAKTVRIETESGRYLRCTPDHQWYTGRNDETHAEYKPASIGSRLMFIAETQERVLSKQESSLSGWLGGLYDGEGSAACGSITVTQSHDHNPEVCSKLETALDTLGYKWNKGIRQPTKTSLGKETTTYWWNGGFDYKRRFLLECNPAKRQDIIELIYKHSSRFVKEKDKVVSIEGLQGLERVFSLETETGNYVAWGFGSKNCLYKNNPVDDETALFKTDDFKFYTPHKNFHENMYVTGTCDPAGEGDDYTAITVVGTDKNKKLFILEAINQQIKPHQIVEQIILLNYKYGFNKFGVETNFFKGTLEDELRRAMEGERSNKNFHPFSIEPIIASAKQKNRTRVLALQPYHERGDIYFPNPNSEKSINNLQRVYSELAFQMLQYTIDGSKSPHDDLLISLSLHMELIKPGGEAKREGPPPTSAVWYEAQAFKSLSNNSRIPRRYKQKFQRTFT